MRRLRQLFRCRIQGKYSIAVSVGDYVHIDPNHDTMRHEATGCPCGPRNVDAYDEYGDEVDVLAHWSLDAREAH